MQEDRTGRDTSLGREQVTDTAYRMTALKLSILKPSEKPAHVKTSTKVLTSDDFKLLIGVLKQWKHFTAAQKAKKQERFIDTQKLVLAIDFYEKSLALKVFRAFFQVKVKRKRLGELT